MNGTISWVYNNHMYSTYEPRHEKTKICICENNAADQLLVIFCACTAQVLSDLFGNRIVDLLMMQLNDKSRKLSEFCSRIM